MKLKISNIFCIFKYTLSKFFNSYLHLLIFSKHIFIFYLHFHSKKLKYTSLTESSSSSATTTLLTNSEDLTETNIKKDAVGLDKLKSISILSLNSDPSHFTTSSFSSHCSATEFSYLFINQTPDKNNSSNNNINNNNKKRFEDAHNKTTLCKEIKNLLDIAENRTRLLCKVYDSSLNEESNNVLTVSY